MSHYDTLGIPSDASQDDIKKAFRRKAQAHHPDREGGSEEEYRKVQKAYDTLSDPEARQEYDLYGDETVDHTPGQLALVTAFASILENEMVDRVVCPLQMLLGRHIAEQLNACKGQKKKLEAALKRLERTLKMRKHFSREAAFLIRALELSKQRVTLALEQMQHQILALREAQGLVQHVPQDLDLRDLPSAFREDTFFQLTGRVKDI